MTLLLMLLAFLVGIWIEEKFDFHWRLSDWLRDFAEWSKFRP